MRIIDLNKLSEEEKQKALEEQQAMLEKRQQASAELQRQANQRFNELINKSGEYDTNKHTTTIGNIQNAYRSNSDYNNVKKSLNTFYRNNNTNSSLWEQIKERAGFTAKKTGAGILSGIAGIGQGIITDTANNMKKGEKEDSNELIENLINSFSSQSPTDYMMKNLPTYAKKQIESLKDKDKNGIEKAVSFVNNAVSEVGNSYNNKLGVLSELVGKISPNMSEELLKANNKISEPINEINMQLDKESEKYGTVANTIANVGQAVGNMTPSILSSVITKNPNVGLATMGLSSKGQSTQEALNKGAELDKAVKIGNTKAMIEVGTEMLTGGVNIFGKGALDDIAEKGILNKVKSNVGKVVAKQGLNVAGETLEETISDILGTAIDKGTVDPNAKYSLKDWKDTAITTTLTTLVLNSLGIVGDIKNISKENKANQNAQNWLKEAESIVNKNSNTDLQQNVIQNQLKTQGQQITQQENKMPQNGNMQQLQQRLQELKNIDTSEMGLLEKSKIKSEIRALEEGYTSVDEWRKANEIKKQEAIKEYNKQKIQKELKKDFSSFNSLADNHKQQQLDIINKNNPADDDMHTWIRSTDDIKNFEEAFFEDGEYSGLDPDFTEKMANKAKETGKITVYSSYPIEQGVFVSPSVMEASQYAGGDSNKLYSKEVNINDIAWIDGAEGQYAKVENSQNSLYNINNESESDINGQINQRNDGTSRLFKESTENQREYSWDEYNKWEESIKPTENITNEEQQSINKSKSEHNKDVFLYDENDNDNTYSGGASRNVKNKINISRQQAEYFGLDFMIDHETIESDILQNQEVYEDIVKPVIEKIQKDNNFKKQVDEFWKNEEGNKPSDRLIAKDIFCDRFAQMRGNELKYENILSQETNMNIDYALNNFYKEIYGKEIEDSNKSSFNLPTEEDVNSKLNLPIKQNTNTQGENINWNEVERPEGKIRKHYQSIIESSNTTKEAKIIAKELMGTDTYIPDSNNKQLERANTRIQNSTPEVELDSLISRTTTGGKIDATDIAVGERLIQYYSLIGDKAKLQESIQATAMAGTTAGQTVQAMSLLKHQTPEGQAVWIQRSVEKMNNDLRKARGEKAQKFDFTAEMQEKIINSKNNDELQNNLNDVYEKLGQQVNKNLIGKIDSWRYFSMLGNPKTHIRNMVGNFLMGKAQDTKNKVAGVIEGTVAKFNTDMERTHTIKISNKEVLKFAKNDIKNVSDRLGLNDNKYNPKSRLENSMRTFKSNAMENTLGRLFKWNDNLLEAEDGLGLKSGYKKALSEYITANKIDINNITDTQLSKARNYAIQQAQERTFHQANTIASAINSFFGKNKGTKAIGDAILPFVKTPANVAKTGIEYSPAGLAKSIVYDSVQLRKGKININQYIDNISKGLTGSGITVLGFALAKSGMLKASGSDDDKKEKFDEQSGKQAYSMKIGDNTYTIDWLAPVGIPLMVGAEIYEGLSQKTNENKTKSNDDNDVTKQFWDRAEVLANSLSNTLDPMVEMSMISGLTSAVKSFAQGDTQALGSMLTNGAKSYVNQFVPTLLGQVAKTIDTVERDTTSTKSGTISKAADSTMNQIKSKVPILRETLPTKKDIWGKDISLADNWAQRFFEAGILPTNSKKINKDKVVTELNDLYDKIGESSILPTTIDKNFTIDSQRYRMTNKEYNTYKTNYGKTSYELIKNLISSKEYNKMNDEQKQKAIENVYTYAKENNKVNYAKNNNLECEQSTLYTTMQDLKNNGGNQSEYLNYLSKISELKKDKEKTQILADSNYTDKTKAIIYKNTTGKEDELYNGILDKMNMNINEYLKYKLQDFESDKKEDGTTSGKSISGSKKKKVYSYVNNMNITKEQRLILLGTQYKLSNSERTELANLINKVPGTSKDEKIKLYEKMQGFTVYKNGTIKW